jgi:large subunit ribosomal protein L25
LSVDPKEVLRVLHSKSGANTLISLTVDSGEPTRVLIKHFQLEPLYHKLLHADFYRIAMDRKLTVTVPVVLKGEAKGVKQQGGVVDFVLREVEIECLPADIPEQLEVDISELLIGQDVRVRDLANEGTWEAVTEGDNLIVHVVPPRAEEEEKPAEEVAAAATATAEPEVMKKGKAEAEEE